MKLIVHRALSAALALSLCLSGAGAAWYGRDIQRQENGNYVLYEPYSDKNIIETPYHLYELTYIGQHRWHGRRSQYADSVLLCEKRQRDFSLECKRSKYHFRQQPPRRRFYQ